MYAVVLASSYGQQGLVIVWGPFTTWDTARSWIATQQNPQNYVVSQAWRFTRGAPPNNVEPLTIVAGQILVALSTANFQGGLKVILYGPYATWELAEAWVAQQQAPESYTVVTVEAV